ncbi:MAG: membrane protein insertion efficiency factor YidD [Elusimicrobia bacterium]|nr:membrane protein insertion efficiency factor YidD [Elusimicrobiota bacterium]
MKFASKLLCALIGVAKLFRPLLGPRACRFSPTCLNYAHSAVSKHGALKGAWLSAKRVLKCHPWHSGGFDPVP